jgi:flagellar hook-basal body complex protein FliE
MHMKIPGNVPGSVDKGNLLSGVKDLPAQIRDESSSPSFGDVLKETLDAFEGIENSVQEKVGGVVTGVKGGSPHEALITLEKADIAFQLMNQVRSKIVRAYEEVMRTQV